MTGFEANVRYCQTTNPELAFEVEAIVAAGSPRDPSRALSVRADKKGLRAVILLTLREQKIVEALAHAKTNLRFA